MTIVNLMASDIWSDADITNRTEAMLRSQFSLTDEAVLNRRVTGASLGIYTMTPADQLDMTNFATAAKAAEAASLQAHLDMAKLQLVLDYEKALVRLALPASTAPATIQVTDAKGIVSTVPNPVYVTDTTERSAALAIIIGVTPASLALYNLRNPPIPTGVI